MKLTTKLATFAAVTLMASNAMAFGLAGGYTGPIKFKYTNFETQVTTVGQELFGIFTVTSINADNPTNTTLWANIGEEITGEFYDYTLANISGSGSQTAFDFTGGIVNLYLDSTPNFNADPYTGNRLTSGTGITDGILFLSLKGASGFTADDPSTALYDESTDTLRSTGDLLTTPFTGKGFGNLEITGGAYANMFGGIGEIMSLNSDLAFPDPQGSQWPVGSEDPLRGTAVPEPGTVALVGLGLAGIAFANRKRMTK